MEHLNDWLEEARKEEAAISVEEETEDTRGIGEEET